MRTKQKILLSLMILIVCIGVMVVGYRIFLWKLDKQIAISEQSMINEIIKISTNLYSQAHEYEKKGDWKMAEEHYKMAIQANPAFENAHFSLGALYLTQNRLKEAIVQFKKVIELDPVNLNVCETLSYIYIDLEKWEDAISMLQQIVDIDTYYSNVHFALGYSYYKVNRPQDALEEMQLHCKLHPDADNIERTNKWIQKIKNELENVSLQQNSDNS